MFDQPLQNQVAIVTGASRGIGQAIALALAQEKARLALVARSREGLEDTCRQVKEIQGSAADGVPLTLCADISREGEVRAALAFVVECLGRVDILINCAGIGVFKPLIETTTEEWEQVMAVNARGPFLMCREVVPLMAQGGGGCIINIASVVGVKGYVNQAAYTASKHALLGMSKVLAQEVQAQGIRVHVVCPGGVDTDLATQARPDLDPSVLMTPADVAAIVLLLIKQRGNALIDQINVRRADSAPWFG